jgi:hypothetical protein
MQIEPSPTADATRVTLVERASPTQNAAGMLPDLPERPVDGSEDRHAFAEGVVRRAQDPRGGVPEQPPVTAPSVDASVRGHPSRPRQKLLRGVVGRRADPMRRRALTGRPGGL